MAEDLEQKIKLTYETNADEVGQKVNKLDDSIEKTTEAQKESTKASGSQLKGLENLGGGIGSTISGMKGMLKQMWLIIANPLGLIIAAIALALVGLFKAFTSTNDGADKFDQVMAGISATIDVVRDRVLKIASAISKFFSGDFKGAMEDGKAAVDGFGDEVVSEFQKASNATKYLQEVEDAIRSLSVARAKLNRDLVEAKEIIDDENASYAEKKKAILDVTKAESEHTARELANAQKKLDAIRELNSLSDTSDEDLKKEADAEAVLYNLQEQSARDRIKNGKLLRKIDNEEKARLAEITKARQEAAKERAKLNEEERKEVEHISKLRISSEEAALRAIQDLNDKSDEDKLSRKKERDLQAIEALKQQGVDVRNLLIYNDELYNTLENELIEKRRVEKVEMEAKAYEEETKAKEKQAEEDKKIEEAKLAQQVAIEDAKRGLLDGGLNFLKNIFSQNKEMQKAILIAENATALARLTINTVDAVGKDTAASPLTFGQPWAGIHIAQGALGAANIIASTAAGLKALGGGSAGLVNKVSAPGSGGNSTPQVSFQASSENQIGNAVSNRLDGNTTIKAYVVESEITEAQNVALGRYTNNSLG